MVFGHRLLNEVDQRGDIHIPLGDSKMGVAVATDQRTNFFCTDFASFSPEDGLIIRT